MKIGILTFHRAKNYGAVLQCYALYKVLSKHYGNVSIIDYAPPYLAGVANTATLYNRIKQFLLLLVYYILNRGETKIKDVFEDFCYRELSLLPVSQTDEIDAMVCGSDQIWNPQICNGFDPMFFGEIKGLSLSCTISYAASMGKTSLDEKQSQEFVSLIKNFDAISVREVSLQTLLSSKDIESTLVIDPVLLAGNTVFDELKVAVPHKKSYVLVYELTRLSQTYEFAQHIAHQIDADVIVIGGGISKYFAKGVKNKQGLSPEQFVSYFANASCVVTNSFHGTAFSILFNKPFYCLRTHTWKDDRIDSLLSQIGLQERFVCDKDKLKFESIDYSTPNLIMQQLQSASENYLLNNLKQ